MKAFLITIIAIFAFSEVAVAASETPAFTPLPEPPSWWATLIGGKEADRSMFPATVVQRSGGGSCTATVIGPRTLISAAHCMNDGGTVRFSLVTGKSYTAKCEHHKDYENNATADWALCLIDREVNGITYEILSMDRSIPKVGEEILLTGYGCTRKGGGGGNDGVLRVGYAKVTRTPSKGNWDIVTRGDVALCFGDSGGPAFYVENDSRKMISVNSRGNIDDTSYLSKTLANETFSGWLADWTKRNGSQKICGIDQTANCYGGEDQPPKDSPPSPDPRGEGGSSRSTVWIIIAALVGVLGLGLWWWNRRKK